MMNTRDIDRILFGDDFVESAFGGTVARDEFVSLSPLWNGLFVFNTDDSTEPGEHWVAVRADAEKREVEFFDTYGRPAEEAFPFVYASVRDGGYSTRWENRRAIQGLTSTVCGDYCVYYCLMRGRGASPERIVETLFSVPDTETRDRSVRRLILSRYGEDSVTGGLAPAGLRIQGVLSKLAAFGRAG